VSLGLLKPSGVWLQHNQSQAPAKITDMMVRKLFKKISANKKKNFKVFSSLQRLLKRAFFSASPNIMWVNRVYF